MHTYSHTHGRIQPPNFHLNICSTLGDGNCCHWLINSVRDFSFLIEFAMKLLAMNDVSVSQFACICDNFCIVFITNNAFL